MLFDANVVDVIVVCFFVVVIQSDVVVVVVVVVVVSLPDELLEDKGIDDQLDVLIVLFETYEQH